MADDLLSPRADERIMDSGCLCRQGSHALWGETIDPVVEAVLHDFAAVMQRVETMVGHMWDTVAVLESVESRLSASASSAC